MNQLITINPDLSNIDTVERQSDRIKIGALVQYFEGEDGKIFLSEFNARCFHYFLVTEPESALLNPKLEGNIVDNALNVITDPDLELYTLFQEPDGSKTVCIYFLPKETTTDVFRKFIDEYLQDDGLDDEEEIYTPPYQVHGTYLN
jgi:hypothetical protein